MDKIDLVIQGPFDAYTAEIVRNYQQLAWVNNIIISCWEGNDIEDYNSLNIKVVKSIPPVNMGIGNRNAHIESSLNGLLKVKTPFAAKLRSDQKISLESMDMMYEYSMKRRDKICVMGFYRPFPFHPRDHSFWGRSTELVELFDIPHDSDAHFVSNPHDDWPNKGFYAKHVRAECYIVSQYLAKKDKRVEQMINRKQEFLTDFSPHAVNAWLVSDELMPKYFAPFPKIDFEWPKHGLKNYDYEGCARHYGEYWGAKD